METEFSHETKKYLEAIHRLQRRREVAKNAELTSELNFVRFRNKHHTRFEKAWLG